MRERTKLAAVVLAFGVTAAGLARAGEIIVIEPGRPGGGDMIVIEPGRPDGPQSAPMDNKTNVDNSLNRAKAYGAPAPQSGGVVILTPESGAPTVAPDPARDNAVNLQRNRARAKAYAKSGSVGGSEGDAKGTTVLILPPGGQVVTGGPDRGHPDNATNAEINTAKAKAYMEGQGGQRLGCSSANVTIGTVGGTAITGNQTTIVTDGVNAWAVGPNCN